MSDDGYKGLKEQLEKLEWPAIYLFKFIVPLNKLNDVLDLFEKADTITKVSRKGNYASITAKPFMYNAEKVIEIYKKANAIEGLLAL